jgi:hypothetical protein
MATPPPGPIYPYRTVGIVLLVVGIVGLTGGVVALSYCSLRVLGFCLYDPYGGVGTLATVVGVVLLIVGIVLMLLTAPAPASPAPPVYYAAQPQYPPAGFYPPPTPGPYYPPRPPVPPDRYCPACGAGRAPGGAFCQTCGKPLSPSP